MEKKELLGFLAAAFLIAILFTEQGTSSWKPLAFMGLIFGIFWWRSN